MVNDPLSPTGYLDWATMTADTVAAGITARSVLGHEMSVSEFSLRPRAEVPRHSHPSEEFGIVVTGGLRLRVGALDSPERVLGPGDTFLIAGDVEHSATAADDGCRLIECYSPPRIPAPNQEQAG